jgi:hypothetical protein
MLSFIHFHPNVHLNCDKKNDFVLKNERIQNVTAMKRITGTDDSIVGGLKDILVVRFGLEAVEIRGNGYEQKGRF